MKRNLILFSVALGIFASAFAFSRTDTQSKMPCCSPDDAKVCTGTTNCCK